MNPNKISDHDVQVIYKTISAPESNEITRQRVVRIAFTDLDATDSSSDDEEPAGRRRIKRRVHEIRLVPGRKSESGTQRFRGVRQRPSGKWVAEIRDSIQNKRHWLGPFETAEDAAYAYNAAAAAIRRQREIGSVSGTKPETESFMEKSLAGGKDPKRYMGDCPMRSGNKWGAAIRDPIQKKRLWLGSFEAAEDAAAAYHAAAPAIRGQREIGSETDPKRYRGVRCPRRPGNKWRAVIEMRKKRMFLGCFETPEEAAAAYDEAAVRLHGDKAVTNFRHKKVEDLTAVGGGQFCSPRSVLLREGGELETPFDWLGSGDVEEFGLGDFTEFYFSIRGRRDEIEFGEFDAGDFE